MKLTRILRHAAASGFVLAVPFSFAGEPAAAQEGTQSYVATLKPLNDDLAPGSPSGTVEFTAEGQQLRIKADVDGVPPGMRLMHYHGHADGTDAVCPTRADDRNGDGIVDLLEAVEKAGDTMVPFHGDPVSLAIPSETYPVANERGELSYKRSVPLGDLSQAVEKKFGTEELDLEKRVVLIHGVPEDKTLPPTAQSLPDVPAEVTVPIACGEIRKP